MGTSVPAHPRWPADTSPAEQLLWRWAVDQLPDEVLVLPQVAMTLREAGRSTEAEADLVLIDPSHGITAVEVKGGTLSYDARRAVWRRGEAGGREVRDPVQQAKRARTVVRHALRSSGVDANETALRWAVAAPECRLDAPGEPVLDPALLWDARSGDDLVRAYRRTVGKLSMGEQPLGTGPAGRLADHLRGRSVEGRQALSSQVDLHEEAVRIHTESHRNVLRQFTTHTNVLVLGAAGTGTTVLALEAAASLASFGNRVLLTCWNVVLAEWLRGALRQQLAASGSPAAQQVTGDPAGDVVVAHVVGLARGSRATPSFAPDERDAAWAYYHEELPELLTPDVTAGEFDAVVLDEAQDLSDSWILAVSTLVRPGGRWYALSDRHQDLFSTNAALPEFLEVSHELRENFRNSRAIAEFASWFGDIEMDCVTGDGPPVRYVATTHDRVRSRAAEVAKRVQRDDKVKPSDLAVLWLFHNPYRGRTDKLATEALAGKLVRTNAASFKGMERPVVVLGLDIDPEKTDRVEEVRRSIYVGASRARSALSVVGDPDVADAYGLQQLAKELRKR